MADIGDLEETIRVVPEPLMVPVPEEELEDPVEVEVPDEDPALVPA